MTPWVAPLLTATLTSLALALLAFPLGAALGFALAVARHPAAVAARTLFTTVLRGVPELTVLYLLYFSLSPALKTVPALGDPQFAIAVAALALVSAAYQAEVFRGALASVPRGQVEAAQAFGLSRMQVLRRVLLPQALAVALPGLGNAWQGLLKTTSIVSLIGLVEIMRQTMLAAASTLRPFLYLAIAAGLYLLLSLLSAMAFRHAAVALRQAGAR